MQGQGFEYQNEAELEESTNRVMMVGAVLLFILALVFPLYRWFEPANRDEARAQNLASLAQQGEETYGFNCASCHGLNGEGGVGPALNSKQFLASATDLQIRQLVSVGVPGSQMGAYAQDFAGPLTPEQIKAISIFIRSWEEKAPDNPEWRAMIDG